MTFCGYVRSERLSPGESPADGISRIVKAISYETYESIFKGEVHKIILEAKSKTSGLRHVVVIHRSDTVLVGDPTVLIIVAAGHQKEALAGIDYITEGIKSRCPIWKRVICVDGHEFLGLVKRTKLSKGESE